MYKFAIVLAGGLGTKFWPKSTESSPKQFTHMVGEGTCIQNTYERLKNYFPKEHIYFVTSYDHRSIIKQQLPDVADSNIIFEPFGRNTSPATALAVRYLLHRGADPESLFAVFPSDHIISNAGEFYNSLDIAFEAAEKLSSIVTIGIKPTRAETQFGYIQVQLSHPKANINGNSVFDCMTFAENLTPVQLKDFSNLVIFCGTVVSLFGKYLLSKMHLPTTYRSMPKNSATSILFLVFLIMLNL